MRKKSGVDETVARDQKSRDGAEESATQERMKSGAGARETVTLEQNSTY